MINSVRFTLYLNQIEKKNSKINLIVQHFKAWSFKF